MQAAQRRRDSNCLSTARRLVGGKLARDEGDLWDTGKVATDQSTQIAYAGHPLISRQAAFWKVPSGNRADQPTAWSPNAFWTTGLLKADDWQAKWIGG